LKFEFGKMKRECKKVRGGGGEGISSDLMNEIVEF